MILTPGPWLVVQSPPTLLPQEVVPEAVLGQRGAPLCSRTKGGEADPLMRWL